MIKFKNDLLSDCSVEKWKVCATFSRTFSTTQWLIKVVEGKKNKIKRKKRTKKVENSYHLQKEMTKSFYDAESYEHWNDD